MQNKTHKIGIISDTHGLLRDEVKEVLKTCDVILHGGDIGPFSILKELKEITAVYAVCGNNDKEYQNYLPQELSLELFGRNFYMIHNKKEMPKNRKSWDIAVYGHSHKYEALYDGPKIWLNPGSCGPRRFRLPVTMAVIEIGEAKDVCVKKITFTQPPLHGLYASG